MQSLGIKISVANIEHTNVINNNDLNPGARLSTDQYVCCIKGRLSYTRGVKIPKKCTQEEPFLCIMNPD